MPYKLYVALKTQEENAKSESGGLLNRLNLTGITHFGKQYKTHTQARFQIRLHIVSSRAHSIYWPIEVQLRVNLASRKIHIYFEFYYFK